MNKWIIDKLKTFINEDEKSCMNFNVNEFMDIIYQNDLYDYTDSIYDENDLTDILRNELDRGNWATVRNMLSGIRNVNEHYFYRDGYGNFSNVTNDDINCIVDDIVNDYQKSCEEKYEL